MLAKIAEQYKKVLRGAHAGQDVGTIRDVIHYQYTTIIAESAFAASDGESRLKVRGDKKLLDFHPAASPFCRCRNCSGTLDPSDLECDDVITALDGGRR